MGLSRGRGTLKTDGTTLVLGNGGTAQVTLSSSSTAARVLTLPDVTDTLVGLAATQTLTNKTLNGATLTGTISAGGATITGLSLTGLAALSLDDTDSAFNLALASTSTLTAGRTLTFDVEDGNRTLRLAGNLITAGANSLTLTTTGATSVTLPTSGTLATTGSLAQFAATTSAQLASVISDETGTGALVFATSPALTAPSFSTISNTGTLTLPTSTDTLVGRATTDTLTNKSISGATNTVTNVSLTTGVTGVLPLANGGTNAGLSATAGALAFSTASALALTGVGTAGNWMVSAGTGTPTWTNTVTTAKTVAVNLSSGSTNGLNLEAYGSAGAADLQLAFVAGRGTKASPTTTQSGDVLGSVIWRGIDNVGAQTGASGLLTATATQTFSTTAAGSKLNFYTTTNGSASGTSRLEIGQDGVGTWSTGIKLPGGTPATLTHYEEGTWTPAPKFGVTAATSITLTNRTFTRIGRVVHFMFDISFRLPAATTGNFTVDGLPYSCSATNTPVTIGWMQSVTMPTNTVMVAAVASTSVNFYYKLHNATASTMTSADEGEFAATGTDMRLWVSGSYNV